MTEDQERYMELRFGRILAELADLRAQVAKLQRAQHVGPTRLRTIGGKR